jgi:hypothetical protein
MAEDALDDAGVIVAEHAGPPRHAASPLSHRAIRRSPPVQHVVEQALLEWRAVVQGLIRRGRGLSVIRQDVEA